MVSLHRREELPLQLEGHNIHDAYTVAILKNSNLSVMNHGVEEWQQGDLYRRCQVWLLDLHVRRSAKLRKCRLDIPEDAHQGGAIASQTTLCRNLGEKRGRRIFEGGVLAGHYGIRVLISVLHVGVRH